MRVYTPMSAPLPDNVKHPRLTRQGMALFVIAATLILLLAWMRIEDRWAEEATQNAVQQSRQQLKESEKRGTRSFGSASPRPVLPNSEPPITTNTVFFAERSMGDWAYPESEWHQEASVYVGPIVEYRRHRRSFPGDLEFRLEPLIQQPNQFSVSLIIADGETLKDEGYQFRYRCDPDASGGSPHSRVEMLRAGKTVATRDFFEPPCQLSLRRCGNHIVGSVNYRAVLVYRDDQPIAGSRIAFLTQGASVSPYTIHIECPNVRDEFFSSAPVDWRPAGSAIADIAERWQCYSDWTFFSLQNDRKAGKNAVLWNKRKYTDDVRMEMFVATRMASERGVPYIYSRDINVSLCPDGSDLTKGYTFLWGGFGNQYSAILRNGVEVARMEKKIPTDMNFNRHWFHYRVERRGSRLSFAVDRFFETEVGGVRRAEMVYEDPDPLPCSRLAIWTYDNSIAISRVRMVGESRPGEGPGAPIPPMKFLIEESTAKKAE